MHNWCNHKLCIRRNYFNMCYFRFTDDSQMFEHLLIRPWYFLNIVLLAGALLLIGLNIVCLKKSCITIKEKISHVSNKSNAQFRRFFNNTTWKLHVLMAFFFSKFLCLLCFVWLFSSSFKIDTSYTLPVNCIAV